MNAGFSKRSGDDLDYDIGMIFVDNYKMYTAFLRAALGSSGFGLAYAVKKVEGGVAVASLGLSYIL